MKKNYFIYIVTVEVFYYIVAKKQESKRLVLEKIPLILEENKNILPEKTKPKLLKFLNSNVKGKDLVITNYKILKKKFSSKINYDYE
jgi:hypothetical protein